MDDSLIEELRSILGPSGVLTEPRDVERYSRDALTPRGAFGAAPLLDRMADVVVRPASVEEVASVVKLARRRRAPVVAYGGGTGVMGALAPVKGGVMVDMGAMNRVLEVNPRNMTATVESGAILADVAEALERAGLMLGHDPWSAPIATVGGAISTNGVGYRASAVGPMGSQVLGLEVVLPTGDVLRTRSVPKGSAGPDLNRLFTGSEGVLGIITKATLRALRQPEERLFSTFRFQDFEEGYEAVVEMFALGLRPAVIDLTEDAEGVHLYLIFEGYKELAAAQRERSGQVCRSKGGRDMGPTKAILYWDARYHVAEGYQERRQKALRGEKPPQQGRAFDYLHVAVPVEKALEYRRRCEAIFKTYDIRTPEFSIWTEPELFSMLLTPGDLTKEGENAIAVDKALKLAQDMGGIMEYCHGVGVKLSHLLGREMGAGLEVVRAIKRALDPDGIMNPGKLGL